MRMKFLKWLLCVFLGLAVVFYGLHRKSRAEEEIRVMEFVPFFSAKPKGVEVIQSGFYTDILGGALYVSVFQISSNSFEKLKVDEHLFQVQVNEPREFWRLSLCNELIDQVGIKDRYVDSSFECFSMPGLERAVRVFYDRSSGEAIALRKGRYDKGMSHEAAGRDRNNEQEKGRTDN